MRALRAVLLVFSLVPALAGCGSGHSSKFAVGAVEDAAKFARDPAAQMRLAREGNLRVVALSAVWEHDSRAAADLPPLRRAVDAAVAEGVRAVLTVYQFSSASPTDAASRAAFVAYATALAEALPKVRDVIVGNEPNLNLFWEPQFGPSGEDAAATAYELLLAEAYDSLKAADPGLQVIGGGLAPRGGDVPSRRPTHSPTQFLLDLGTAYRASGRSKPLMDAFSLHVYGESARIPPTLEHPRTTSLGVADYARLVDLLGRAFDGTAQDGSSLPIVYGEYGVETTIPPAKRALYTGQEVVRAVDEQTQASFYEQAIALAACQPTVELLLLFHVVDEPRLEGLQSGTRYADGSPKSSYARVRDAAGRGCAHG